MSEGWRVEGRGLKVEDGGWKMQGDGWRVEGGGWRVEGCRPVRKYLGVDDFTHQRLRVHDALHPVPNFHLTESDHKVDSRKSIPAQIRLRVLYVSNNKKK